MEVLREVNKMVCRDDFQGQESFKCEECGFHYEEKELAEKCEEFCREKGVCNFDITTESLERGAIT
jgi:hypothetical protein